MVMASASSRNEASLRLYSSAFASSSVSNFSPRTSTLMTHSSSLPDANVGLHGHRSPPSPTSSVRFSVEQRPKSPGRRSMTVMNNQRNNAVTSKSSEKRMCMCSPSTHPGSFRCSYHKQLAEQQQKQHQHQQQQRQKMASSSGSKLNLRRSAMKNSLIRIGRVEGELVKRTLTTLIRPTSHQIRRREAFQPRPSRLSVMSKCQES